LIGFTNPDKNGICDYKEFAYKCESIIDEMFSLKALCEKAEIIKQGIVRQEETNECLISNIELFKVTAIFKFLAF
jgi:hypothetical protein